MATADTDRGDDWTEEEPGDVLDDEIIEDVDADIDDEDIDADIDEVVAGVEDDDDDDDDDDVDGGTEALDKLEEEELEMLTEDEAAESLPVDEAEELRQLRRAAIALEAGAEDLKEDEFVCANCFLVKATSQLANRRKKLCRDCI